MSIEFDQIKSDIDDLDFELNGSLWTIGGVKGIQSIKEESIGEFESVYGPVVELSVRTKDFPIDINQGATVINEATGQSYTISKILPEIDGLQIAWISENV